MVESHQHPKLFFVTYGGGHVDIVLRLLPALKKIKHVRIKILALTTASLRLAQDGWEYSRCIDYVSFPGYKNAIKIGNELSDGLWKASSGIERIESDAYLGVSMIDLINDLGESEARYRYQEDGRNAFCPRNFMRQVIKHENPDLIITTCHVRMERASILAARDLDIQSVRIDDLFGYSLLGEYSNESTAKLISSAEWPDDVVVLNSEVKRRLTHHGFPSSHIHALGQPVFSEWIESFASSKPSDSLAECTASNKPIVTYVTPARRDILHSQAAALISIAERRNEWCICIKLHPSICKEEFLEHFPFIPNNVKLIEGEDILGIVKASTLVIIFRSTVGMLCLIGGVKLLVVDDTDEDEIIPYVTSGAAEFNSNLSKLEHDIYRILTEAITGNYNNTNLFQCPLGATARIANWLSNKASENISKTPQS